MRTAQREVVVVVERAQRLNDPVQRRYVTRPEVRLRAFDVAPDVRVVQGGDGSCVTDMRSDCGDDFPHILVRDGEPVAVFRDEQGEPLVALAVARDELAESAE